MRMRKKRHLDERLAAADGNLLLVEGSRFYERPEAERGHPFKWDEVFGNDNPVEVEIGCGKGQFIVELAKRNPDVNYVAVEKISNVIITAYDLAQAEGVTNVRFLNADAYNLKYYFTYPVARAVYLNFSTPYPQSNCKGKRLTNPKFLRIYSDFMVDGGKICQKTDDRTLFEYSIESFSACGFTLTEVSLDLHNSFYASKNIVTEYEKSFSDKGMPIYALTAIINK